MSKALVFVAFAALVLSASATRQESEFRVPARVLPDRVA
jgi:hypothetical protein